MKCLLRHSYHLHSQNLNSGHVLSHMRALFLFSSTLGAIMTAILDTCTSIVSNTEVRYCTLHTVPVLGMPRNFNMNRKFMSAVH